MRKSRFTERQVVSILKDGRVGPHPAVVDILLLPSWIPVDSTAANKRLTSNVLDYKLRVVSQLPKHGRTGSTPCASTTATV